MTGFLTAQEIEKREAEFFKPGVFDEKRADGASYDLCLGEEVYISGSESPIKLSDANPFICIPRGQFALLMTKEYVMIPQKFFALISIKFSIKKLGIINISGFHVDPTWEGNLVFSIFNAGPNDVILKYGDPVFMIFFYELTLDAKVESKINYYKNRNLPVDIVTSIKGSSASLSDVEKRVRDLELTSKLFIGLLISVAVGLILALINSFISGGPKP